MPLFAKFAVNTSKPVDTQAVGRIIHEQPGAEMTVRFEFEMSDVDAENLLNVLQSARTRAMADAGRCLAKGDEGLAGWLNQHADYLAELKNTVATGSTRVE